MDARCSEAFIDLSFTFITAVYTHCVVMRTSTGAVMLSRSVSGLPCSGWVGKGPWLCWQSSAQEKAIAAHCGVRSCLPGKSQARHNVAARSEAHGTRRAPYAPSTPPVTQRDIERLVRFFVEHRNVLVIAGAGCSTESGIPDYRGPAGAYTNDGYKPMTHQKVRSVKPGRLVWTLLRFAFASTHR